MDNSSSNTGNLPPATTRSRSDRRISRTRRQLKEALFALIIEKGYDAVTIEDITTRADLGRTTFYLHYRDKEELLLELIDTISDELMEQVAPIRAAIELKNPLEGSNLQKAIQIVFQHAAENHQLYLIILHGEGSTRAASRVREIIAEKVSDVLSASIEARALHLEIPIEIFTHHFAGSLLGLITWWLENELPYTPHEMAEMFRQLYFQGGRKMLGID